MEGAVIIGKLLERTEADGINATLGYNAATGQYEDLVKAGIIDPLKVRCLPSYGLHKCSSATACQAAPCHSLCRAASGLEQQCSIAPHVQTVTGSLPCSAWQCNVLRLLTLAVLGAAGQNGCLGHSQRVNFTHHLKSPPPQALCNMVPG